MPSAEIISIGTELLLGEITDTNSQYLASGLRQTGIDLFRMTTIGDNLQRIAQAIRESMKRCEIIITTGGLGPTVDDPTREAVALALGVELEYHPELWEQIQSRFKRYNRIPTENNKKQAFIPKGAIPVENKVGTAPCFICNTNKNIIIAFPGVPKEMMFVFENTILPYLKTRFVINTVIKTRVLHTVGIGESKIDSLIEDLELQSNPTVGLAAHSGQVDVRITAKSTSDEQAYNLINPVESILRERLGKWIYGADQESIESAVLKILQERNWSLVVVEAGMNGQLISRLSTYGEPYLRGEVLGAIPSVDAFNNHLRNYKKICEADVALGALIKQNDNKSEVFITLIILDTEKTISKLYGGPPDYASRWAVHHSLDILREI